MDGTNKLGAAELMLYSAVNKQTSHGWATCTGGSKSKRQWLEHHASTQAPCISGPIVQILVSHRVPAWLQTSCHTWLSVACWVYKTA